MELVKQLYNKSPIQKFCKSVKVNLCGYYECLKSLQRTRRQSVRRGRYRGQTQSQYIAVDHENGKDDGKAEAHSDADSSRASVSGSRGMGQAQSQTMYDPNCDGWYGRRDAGAESLRRHSDGYGGYSPGQGGTGGSGRYGLGQGETGGSRPSQGGFILGSGRTGGSGPSQVSPGGGPVLSGSIASTPGLRGLGGRQDYGGTRNFGPGLGGPGRGPEYVMPEGLMPSQERPGEGSGLVSLPDQRGPERGKIGSLPSQGESKLPRYYGLEGFIPSQGGLEGRPGAYLESQGGSVVPGHNQTGVSLPGQRGPEVGSGGLWSSLGRREGSLPGQSGPGGVKGYGGPGGFLSGQGGAGGESDYGRTGGFLSGKSGPGEVPSYDETEKSHLSQGGPEGAPVYSGPGVFPGQRESGERLGLSLPAPGEAGGPGQGGISIPGRDQGGSGSTLGGKTKHTGRNWPSQVGNGDPRANIGGGMSGKTGRYGVGSQEFGQDSGITGSISKQVGLPNWPMFAGLLPNGGTSVCCIISPKIFSEKEFRAEGTGGPESQYENGGIGLKGQYGIAGSRPGGQYGTVSGRPGGQYEIKGIGLDGQYGTVGGEPGGQYRTGGGGPGDQYGTGGGSPGSQYVTGSDGPGGQYKTGGGKLGGHYETSSGGSGGQYGTGNGGPGGQYGTGGGVPGDHYETGGGGSGGQYGTIDGGNWGQYGTDSSRLDGQAFEARLGSQHGTGRLGDPHDTEMSPGGQYGTGVVSGGQYGTGRVPGGQYDIGGGPVGQYGTGEGPEGQFRTEGMPGGRYSTGEGPGGQYGTGGRPGDQYDTGAEQYNTGRMTVGQYGARGVPGGQYGTVDEPGGQYGIGEGLGGQHGTSERAGGQDQTRGLSGQYGTGGKHGGQYDVGGGPVVQYGTGDGPAGQYGTGGKLGGQYGSSGGPESQYGTFGGPGGHLLTGALGDQYGSGGGPGGQFGSREQYGTGGASGGVRQKIGSQGSNEGGQYGTGAFMDQGGANIPGVPQNVVEPSSIAASLDGFDSDAQANVAQIANGTVASAISRGGNDKDHAQTNVQGTNTGSGSFSAQAEITDENKAAQSQVEGGKKGAKSSAQGRGHNNLSQAAVHLGSETGTLQTTAASKSAIHSSNSQVQGSLKGGMADAQARGPGGTSSQAQIGFTPYKEGDTAHEVLKTPFVAKGSAFAQSSRRAGQSQSSLQGTFKYGLSYSGAAQAGASSDKDAVFSNRLPLNSLNVFDEKKKNINVNTESPPEYETTPEQDTSKKLAQTMNSSESRYTSSRHKHSDHHKTEVMPLATNVTAPADSRRSFQPSYGGNGADYEYSGGKDTPDDYYPDGGFEPDETDTADGEQSEYPNYDEYTKDSYSDTHQYLNSSAKIPLEVKQTAGGNTQNIVLGSLNAGITHRNLERPDENRIYQPGERVPGTGGYTIPIGFTGNVKSVGSKDKTYVAGSKLSPSQVRTVSLSPGTGKVKYVYPPLYGKNVNPNDLKSLNNKKAENRYVSVSKSVTHDLGSYNNVRKQYSHTYYTKSSLCGYFTFTCTMVSGVDGNKKVCRPKIPKNPDGTPMKC